MKLHPSGKEKRTWYKELEKLNNFSITKNKNLYSLLSKSKYLIVEGSTVGSEAPIFDTEVIVLTVNQNALCDYTDHPIYFKTNTAEKINKILNNNLSRSKKYKKSFIEELMYKIDGKTHLRIKKEIEELLKFLRR